jgi:putative endonuclease
MAGQYFVYIMSSFKRVLYIGVTNDLNRRVAEHKSKLIPGLTSKYNVTSLVYFEEFHEISEAISREKVRKGWTRAKKITLIESFNSEWKDFAASK